jgi:hypothetical protein
VVLPSHHGKGLEVEATLLESQAPASLARGLAKDSPEAMEALLESQDQEAEAVVVPARSGAVVMAVQVQLPFQPSEVTATMATLAQVEAAEVAVQPTEQATVQPAETVAMAEPARSRSPGSLRRKENGAAAPDPAPLRGG